MNQKNQSITLCKLAGVFMSLCLIALMIMPIIEQGVIFNLDYPEGIFSYNIKMYDYVYSEFFIQIQFGTAEADMISAGVFSLIAAVTLMLKSLGIFFTMCSGKYIKVSLKCIVSLICMIIIHWRINFLGEFTGVHFFTNAAFYSIYVEIVSIYLIAESCRWLERITKKEKIKK